MQSPSTICSQQLKKNHRVNLEFIHFRLNKLFLGADISLFFPPKSTEEHPIFTVISPQTQRSVEKNFQILVPIIHVHIHQIMLTSLEKHTKLTLPGIKASFLQVYLQKLHLS